MSLAMYFCPLTLRDMASFKWSCEASPQKHAPRAMFRKGGARWRGYSVSISSRYLDQLKEKVKYQKSHHCDVYR